MFIGEERKAEFSFQFPELIIPVIKPPSRYKVLYGGRGSAKSWSVARELIIRAAFGKVRILCAREFQSSIKDSVHKLLTDQIKEMGLSAYFVIQENSIKSIGGSEFIFKGLHNNSNEIKSMEGIDIVWVEEAEAVSETSWKVLIPTIRKEGSEIWITFNPRDEKSSTYTKFVVNCPPDCLRAEVNFWDNPWFPEVLRKEMQHDKENDPEAYEHVWCGKPEKYGQSLIFRGKFRVEEFEAPADARFYYGTDFGFSSDALALVRCFIKDKNLYIDYEFYGHGIELDDIAKGYDTVPGSRKWKITADSARPDTIAHLRKQGFMIEGAEKGPGSVEDGIEYLKKFKAIIIHPRCKGTKHNFENYRWKVDKNTNEILPIPIDKHNHVPDSLRYALEKLMKAKTSIFDVL